MKSHPLSKCLLTANEQVHLGNEVYQKFECDNCKAEQYIERPNTFYKYGKCEECNHITNLIKKGCNYLLIIKGAPRVIHYLENSFEKEPQNG